MCGSAAPGAGRGLWRGRPVALRAGLPASGVGASDRTASLERTTSESSVRVSVNLDGSGKGSVSTGVRFYDHMLLSLAKHSLIDLDIHRGPV